MYRRKRRTSRRRSRRRMRTKRVRPMRIGYRF